MKAKSSHRSFKAMIIASVIAVAGGFVIYRNLFTPKVQMRRVAQTWLDHSAGKTTSMIHQKSAPIHRRVTTIGCHVPKPDSVARHTKKHKHKRRHLARTHHRSHYQHANYQAGN